MPQPCKKLSSPVNLRVQVRFQFIGMCKVLVKLVLACELHNSLYCEATKSGISTSHGWNASRTQDPRPAPTTIFCQVAMEVRTGNQIRLVQFIQFVPLFLLRALELIESSLKFFVLFQERS